MGRVLKNKKAKANFNASEDLEKDAVEQGNGSVLPSDEEESGTEKKNLGKRTKRGRKSDISKKSKKPRQSPENGDGSEVEPNEESGDDSAPLSKKAHVSKKATDKKVEEAVDEDQENEEDYEVEKIVDCKIQRGEKYYLVRWKGYEEDKDTWESEANLNCLELIEEFLSDNPDALGAPSKSKSKKKAGGTKKGRKLKSSAVSKVKQEPIVDPVSEEDGQKVYEVDKIIEVHFKKNGSREFLIRWKGFSNDDDTWEPETNLNCPDLIEKFMQKVNKAREVSVRELRADPQVTKRFTLNTREQGRRLSNRHQSKQRATYYNNE